VVLTADSTADQTSFTGHFVLPGHHYTTTRCITMQITHYDNPAEQIDDNTLKQLTAAAQSAFDRDGMPTRDDVRDHTDVDRLLTAQHDSQIVGFSATESYDIGDGMVYAAGLAVHEDYQGNGIGSLLRIRGILEQMDGDQTIVTTRTQNPAVVSYFDDYFDAYPKPAEDRIAPDHLQTAVEAFADDLDPSSEFEYPVMREAYPGSMYDGLPDHPLREPVEEMIDHRKWRCAPSRRGGRPAPAGA